MRKEDDSSQNYKPLRRKQNLPAGKTILRSGSVLVPCESIAVTAIVASSVVVTVFDNETKQGGMCHFIRPWPGSDDENTAQFGLPACVALLKEFLENGKNPESLFVGVYGGAWPAWATASQREISHSNRQVVCDIMKRKNIRISDEDTGGMRGRKIVFITGTNEVAIIKTPFVRSSDWFPEISKGVVK